MSTSSQIDPTVVSFHDEQLAVRRLIKKVFHREDIVVVCVNGRFSCHISHIQFTRCNGAHVLVASDDPKVPSTVIHDTRWGNNGPIIIDAIFFF